MTARKRLPYSANQAIDDVKMSLSDIRHLILPILRMPPPKEDELVRIVGLSLDKAHQALHALDEIKTEPEPNGNGRKS